MKSRRNIIFGEIRGSRSGTRALALQGIALSLAFLIFALLPPDHGPVLLLPLDGHGAAGLIGPNLKLMGTGRFPGSLVATGMRPPLLEALTSHAVLILPAVPLLCGPAAGLES